MKLPSLLVVLSMMLPGSVLAQSAPPGASKTDLADMNTRSSSAAASPTLTAEDEAAWELYHRGTLNLAVGDVNEAKRVFLELIDTRAAHPLASKAKEIIEIVDGPAGLTGLLSQRSKFEIPASPKTKKESVSDSGKNEHATGLARGELATGQTIHGITLGIELCVLAECQDERVIISSILLGAGAGLAGSLLYQSDGVRPGQTAALNSGVLWGAWFGSSFSIAFDLVRDEKTFVSIMMLSQVGGLVGGGLLYEYFEPTAGDVSLVNSSGLWSGVMTALILDLAEVNGQTDFWAPMFFTTHLAGAAAAILSRSYSMSRGRVLMIDGSGLLGGLVGLSAVILTAGRNATSEAIQVGSLVGIGGGLVLGTYLSRNFDGPGIDTSLAIVPTEGGAIFTLGTTL
jgi:hypothetical protein